MKMFSMITCRVCGGRFMQKGKELACKTCKPLDEAVQGLEKVAAELHEHNGGNDQGQNDFKETD